VAAPGASAECSACGCCCDPVWYAYGPGDLRQLAERTESPDARFAVAHWHPTGEQSDAGHAYRCDFFDPVTRLCTGHEERPPICRGYPWYDEAPGQRLVVLPEPCAFRADL
jgi:Fe-S-cluster containining protein